MSRGSKRLHRLTPYLEWGIANRTMVLVWSSLTLPQQNDHQTMTVAQTLRHPLEEPSYSFSHRARSRHRRTQDRSLVIARLKSLCTSWALYKLFPPGSQGICPKKVERRFELEALNSSMLQHQDYILRTRPSACSTHVGHYAPHNSKI